MRINLVLIYDLIKLINKTRPTLEKNLILFILNMRVIPYAGITQTGYKGRNI